MKIWTLCSLALACTFTTSILAEDKEVEVVEVKAQNITLSVPTTWKKEEPSNNLRLAQFSIPAVEGDNDSAELVVFPPFGGSIRANVDRWIAQFESEGRKLKMSQGVCEQGDYVLVDLTGTYKKPDGPPFRRKTIAAPGYRMLATILTAKGGGNYFLKVTGPEKTVKAAVDAFRTSFGADADKEKPYEEE